LRNYGTIQTFVAAWMVNTSVFNSHTTEVIYKNYNSIVLQAVVDAEGNFLFVDVREAGRHSDGGVFATSNFGRILSSKH